MAINLSSGRKVYLIGIGGIGVSALARKYLSDGWQVAGSDRLTSKITTELEKLGVKIFLKQKAGNITADIDLVIYTIAIPDHHPELVRARRLRIKVLSYPEALGELSRKIFTVAIAGTHGKTTTAAMLAEIMSLAGFDPTVIVGSLMNFSGDTNFVAGKSQYLIVEACEYRRSFLNLSPRILVITNIDNDHLDYYRDLADIQSAFAELAGKIPSTGTLICDKRDPRLQPVLLDIRCLTIDYRQVKERFKLKVPGEHNILNAQAALAAAKAIGIDLSTALGALNKFTGTWRRFEYKGRTKAGALICDDYAHHPTEIQATLAAAREKFPKRRLIVVFQPHLYSRTKLLFDDFVTSFDLADELIVLPIYAAREKSDPKVTSQSLAQAIGARGLPTKHLASFKTVRNYLNQHLRRGDLLLTLGAGDVYNIGQRLLDKN